MSKVGESPDNNLPKTLGSAAVAGAESVASDERWCAVQQIAASPTFQRSPRLKELLLFIARHTLDGNHLQLTESEIAHQVFGRGSDYVGTEDSIVRSSARQLRWKLAEFEASAKGEPRWTVDIPKGKYIARFQLRESVAQAAAMPHAVAPELPSKGWLSSRTAMAFVGTALVFSLVVNIWFATHRAASNGGKPLGLTAELITGHPGHTNVVMDDYAYVLMAPRPFPPADTMLDNYAGRSYISRSAAPSRDPELLRLWDLLGTRYIVSLGAAATADRIVRSVPQQDKVVLRHSRNVVARDFQQENHILFGSPPNNPWTILFENQLNFQASRLSNGSVIFTNRNPVANQEKVYGIRQSASLNSGSGYARIAYLPNLSHTGFILMVTGLNMVTAEAAGEFATNPGNLPVFLKAFHASRAADLPYFEVLLRTAAVDNVPTAVSVIDARKVGFR